MYIDFTASPIVADLAGFASNVTGAGPWAILAEVQRPTSKLAHLVTIRNDSITDHAAKTITITGTDASGRAQVEAIAGPGTSATVSSTKFFSTVTSVAVSATIGADTFDIGYAVTAVSHAFPMCPEASALPAFQVVQTGTCGWDLASTLADPLRETNVGDATFANDGNFTAKSASVVPTVLAVRAKAVRLEINSVTSTPTLRVFGAVPEQC